MIGQPVADQHGRDGLLADSREPRKSNWSNHLPAVGQRLRSILGWPRRMTVRVLRALIRRRMARRTPSGDVSILEIGVGGGSSLTAYPPNAQVTAVDDDPRALARARVRVAAKALDNVHGLYRMAAETLGFPDHSFDRIAAYHTVFESKAPVRRARTLRELSRVMRSGGCLTLIERASWITSDLRTATSDVSQDDANRSDDKTPNWIARCGLRLLHREQLDPLGLFVALTLQKTEPAPAA
ncbi:MAG: class I SAM-dependent methyltransferase [Pseudomonadota bacterium]